MPVSRLSPPSEAGLRSARFTYSEVGQTAGEFPTGYRTLQRNRQLPAESFDAAVGDLMTWRIHQRAGLHLLVSGTVAADAVVVLQLGFRAASVRAPCRVVYTVDEPDRRGFAYGTLPGHPETGEEAFIIERSPGGVVTFTVHAFSKPASAVGRAAGPVGHWVQDRITQRYLRAAAP